MSRRTSVAVALVVSLAFVAMATARRPRRQHAAAPDTPLTFVGASACASCHPLQTARWQSSKHARSMQAASRADIAAPFARETFSVEGEATTFSRRGDTFVVRATGPDGAVRDLNVAYALGIYPLQQYLLGLPGGRLQALGVAWDARPAPVGQRWYQTFAGTRCVRTVTRRTSERITGLSAIGTTRRGRTSTSRARRVMAPAHVTSPGPVRVRTPTTTGSRRSR